MPKSDLDGFPATVSIPVQWGEQDGFGHINNMHFIRWFESARIAYLLKCGARMTTEGIGPILASVKCDYRRQVKYPDTVIVGARIVKIGRSSMKMEHQLFSTKQNEIAAEGESTVVLFDYENQRSHPIPIEMRQKIEELEGRSLSNNASNERN